MLHPDWREEESFNNCVTQNLWTLTYCNPLMRTRTCEYQGVAVCWCSKVLRYVIFAWAQSSECKVWYILYDRKLYNYQQDSIFTLSIDVIWTLWNIKDGQFFENSCCSEKAPSSLFDKVVTTPLSTFIFHCMCDI